MILIRRPLILLIFSLLCLNRADAQSLDDSLRMDSLIQVAEQLQRAADSMILAGDTIQKDSVKTITPSEGTIHRITGSIKDKNTGEGIPFATIFFPGSPTGTAADLDGRFDLSFDQPPGDTLVIQALGYKSYKYFVRKNSGDVDLPIELEREAASLSEFVFHGGEDPALVLLKKVIRHKPLNNPDRLEQYRYEAYNKLEVDLQHLTKKQFESLPIPMIKQFSFIYNNLDTLSEKTPFLPFYLTETLSDYYYQKQPKKTKEFIKASQVKGVKNESITRFLGTMEQNINAYNNFIPIFDKSFVSPVSDNAAFYYKYKIKDTQTAFGRELYLVQFTPRRPGENCFYGDFWVSDSVFALQRISMEVPHDANINFVHRVSLYQEFAPIGDTAWFTIKDKFISDFTAPYGAKLPSFIGRKTTTYRDIRIDDPAINQVLNDPKNKDNVIVAADARTMNDSFWNAARHDTLSANERAIYHMIDTLDHLPSFQRFKNIIKFVAEGTVPVGPVEFGPYYYLYSSNPVEGQRFRFSMGTTPKLFKDAYLSAYIAYGTKDKEYKYSGSVLWILQKHPRMYLYGQYTHDLNRGTSSDGQLTSDNVLSHIARKPDIPYKLAMEDLGRFEFFKEYFGGFSHMVYGQYRNFTPYAPLPAANVFTDAEGSPSTSMTSAEVGIKLRYARHEDFLEGNYYRFSLGSAYPIIELKASMGLKNVLGGGYDYKRASLRVFDDVRIAPFGWLHYNFFAGKVWGTVPYPLLEIHPGNEFYYYNTSAFNMMNNYEFISDQYAGFFIEHTIGSGIFNYIPLLKKAKLRQFWTAKGIIGSLSDANTALNLNKGYPFRTLEGTPYVEVGTGVENILQLFRIDFVWRVTPKPLSTENRARYFGIFGSVKFGF